jgi:L-asparaginase
MKGTNPTMARRVLILHTGGTLGMQPREPDQALAPDQFGATVLEHVPELRRIADIETRVLFNLDSSDLAPTHWMALTDVVFAAHNDYAGVVITHGTDAMVYTASALSFVLNGLPFPVVLTGSQRPLADVHSDGRANLVGAVDLALRPIPEVSLYFDGLLLRGNRAIKYSTFAFGAYQSPNFAPLAQVGTSVRLGERPLQPSGEFRIEGRFDERVAVVWLHPGDDGSVLSGLIDSDRAAVLIAAFGNGNIPVTDGRVADAIRGLTGAGKVVAIGSQSPSANVDLERYAGGRLAQQCGAIGIGDMTIEAATVKLMYLCGTFDSPRKIQRELLRPIAGEITPPSKS